MVVKPVILTKASVKLAIYGIGNIKDERLHEVLLSLVFMLALPPWQLLCRARSAQRGSLRRTDAGLSACTQRLVTEDR